VTLVLEFTLKNFTEMNFYQIYNQDVFPGSEQSEEVTLHNFFDQNLKISWGKKDQKISSKFFQRKKDLAIDPQILFQLNPFAQSVWSGPLILFVNLKKPSTERIFFPFKAISSILIWD